MSFDLFTLDTLIMKFKDLPLAEKIEKAQIPDDLRDLAIKLTQLPQEHLTPAMLQNLETLLTTEHNVTRITKMLENSYSSLDTDKGYLDFDLAVTIDEREEYKKKLDQGSD